MQYLKKSMWMMYITIHSLIHNIVDFCFVKV